MPQVVLTKRQIEKLAKIAEVASHYAPDDADLAEIRMLMNYAKHVPKFTVIVADDEPAEGRDEAEVENKERPG